MALVSRALAFASRMHEGMVRKGTNVPYIVHPVEVAEIVASMTDDEHVIAAALLHDVMEDCGVTKQELESSFGERVACLVEAETQRKEGDPRATWERRKQATVARLAHAPREERLIALGDKLSNMRAICRDYLKEGDSLFLRFNQPDKRRYAWYYCSCAHELRKEFGDTGAFRELEQLIYSVFCPGNGIETLSSEEGFAV